MTDDKILAAAKKAARRMARATGTSYQTCLDTVAQGAGRAHWGAFLADPVDVTRRAADEQPTALLTPVDEPGQATPPDHHADEMLPHVELGQPASRSVGSRIARMLVGPERGIVRRSEQRQVLTRIRNYGMGSGMPLGRSVENGYDLVADKSLPILVLAPPRTGRSACVSVPTIIGSDRHSLVIHDEFDLAELTSGHRASLGPVTVLNLEHGRSRGSLNPLSSAWLPTDAAARTSYVSAIADAVTSGNRAAHDAIMRTILDLSSLGGGTTFRTLHAKLKQAGNEASAAAAVLLSPFLDPAAVTCTEGDGMGPLDLRGVRDSEGQFRPATLYVVRGNGDGGRQAAVAATLQAAVWWWTLSTRPSNRTPDGEIAGPLPVTVVLEDVHRFPIMPALAAAVVRGPARQLGHVVTSFTYGACSRALGVPQDEVEALFAIRIVLPQNDTATVSLLERSLHGVTRNDLRYKNDTHLLAIQSEPEPVRVRPPFFFKVPWMMERVYNPRRGKGPKPCTP